MFGEALKQRLKEKLLHRFNLHTIVRLPGSVFAPYTSISTNILFDHSQTGTEETWYYELPLPEGYKAFSKTKPMSSKHFDQVREWWNNREESEHSWKVTKEEIIKRNYNLDFKNRIHRKKKSMTRKCYWKNIIEFNIKIKTLQESLLEELRDLLL